MSEITYREMPVGRRFSPHRFDLDGAQIARYESLFDSAGSPPTGLLAVHARKAYATDGPFATGGVMAQMSITLHEVFGAGEGYEFNATVVENYGRSGKAWIRFRCELSRGETAVATVEILGVWPL
jgi:hypothetical protein